MSQLTEGVSVSMPSPIEIETAFLLLDAESPLSAGDVIRHCSNGVDRWYVIGHGDEFIEVSFHESILACWGWDVCDLIRSQELCFLL